MGYGYIWAHFVGCVRFNHHKFQQEFISRVFVVVVLFFYLL